MTSAPVHITGPAADTRNAHDTTQTALRDAAGRSAELLRRVGDGSVPVPGLTWTAAELLIAGVFLVARRAESARPSVNEQTDATPPQQVA